MKLKYTLALLLLANLVISGGPEADQGGAGSAAADSDDDESSEKQAAGLVAKFVKKRPTFIGKQQHIVLNPRDCYVSMSLFPLEFYIDLEKLLLRIRLISNCFPTRDIVLLSQSNFPKEPTETRHPKVVKLTLFRDEWLFKFKQGKMVRQADHFSKVRYGKAVVKSQNFEGKISVKKENFMEVDAQISNLNLYRLKKIQSPTECAMDDKLKYMICNLF